MSGCGCSDYEFCIGREDCTRYPAAPPDAPAEGWEPDDYPYEAGRDDYGSL